jgi:hypothetical protein
MRPTITIILALVITYSCKKEPVFPALYSNIVAGDSISDGTVYTDI